MAAGVSEIASDYAHNRQLRVLKLQCTQWTQGVDIRIAFESILVPVNLASFILVILNMNSVGNEKWASTLATLAFDWLALVTSATTMIQGIKLLFVIVLCVFTDHCLSVTSCYDGKLLSKRKRSGPETFVSSELWMNGHFLQPRPHSGGSFPGKPAPRRPKELKWPT